MRDLEFELDAQGFNLPVAPRESLRTLSSVAIAGVDGPLRGTGLDATDLDGDELRGIEAEWGEVEEAEEA